MLEHDHHAPFCTGDEWKQNESVATKYMSPEEQMIHTDHMVPDELARDVRTVLRAGAPATMALYHRVTLG